MANSFNQQIIDEFRANEGRVGGMFEGSPLVLLTTTGAKSGNPTTTPVMYLADGDRHVVIASNAGADNHPAWYHNLRANPTATAEIGVETFEVKADFIEGEERDRLYARMVAVAPGFAEYEAKTSRRIPVVALHRAP
ncbi:MAG: nitroreductase family deazaflavin-dependent oxidoreductase [Nonomuraea sp.]|nr:nitroreductase family deazaflavin-dependent oxidoreductase [Nonomuraea sp.]NUP68561.1 nitroreductase family deazaflavin-dependent oxidoreductase [Nonomuraea sp.]NUP81295.1 nitroreductase family deazaflavin-dependent oxidoreductase [Nonomuraea sp.]NUS09524.1 nitroreductase family deazaflavin-dependent oxidoreductase [Nonomuraea sp.]NUT09518.1 nitroreductase family deazaflavin-dependent oxidoreductase [Nonomuraea sp.]